jgi:hypothetical protein
MIKVIFITFDILMLIHFNIVPLQDAILGIIILAIPLAVCYGFLTNLFIPSGSRRQYIRTGTDSEYE